MVCPFCLHKKTDVYNTRTGSRLNTTWRRRQCPKCNAQFTTYESADLKSLLCIKDGKRLLAYSPFKTLLKLIKACDHRRDLDESVPYLAATIEQKLLRAQADSNEKAISKVIVTSVIAETLKPYDAVAYVKFIGNQKHIGVTELRRSLKGS